LATKPAACCRACECFLRALPGGLVRGRFRVGQEPEDHGPGPGWGITCFPLVAGDQFLLVGDEPRGFLAGERESGGAGSAASFLTSGEVLIESRLRCLQLLLPCAHRRRPAY
jgi:hypothetical protein